MMKLVFFYVCIIVCLTHNLFGQLTETALTNNPQLSRINSSARNSQDDVVKLFLITGSTIQYCPHSNLIEGEIARLEYGECTTLAHGFFVAGDVCSEYTNDGSVGTDVICLTICDSLDNCRNLEIHFTSREAMSLPFIDDFSNGSTDPDPVLWIDQDVFINNSLAERALSLGVATFDGLDEGGTPYESGAGYSDALTSTFLDLSTANIVFVSFFVQPKGFGLKPREQDSIVLDFKSTGGEWIRVWQREGLPSSFSSRNPAPDFSFESVEVADSFRYAGFQFRFRNKSKNEGLQELWHLDYVRVTSQIPPSESIEDIAFVKPPKGVLKTYSAMPWAQFAGSEVDEVTDELQIEIYNHFDEVETANPSRLLMNEQVTETSLISNLTLLEVPPIANENQRNLSPGRHQFTNDLDPGRFINTLISIQPVDQELRIETIYEFEQDQETNNGIAAILRNNRTSAMTVLSDYYAYDDGTAESAIIDRGSNQMTRLAIEFEANVSDSLKGVQVMIPHIEGDITTQRFNLMIWVDSLSDEPIFRQDLIRPYYTDAFFDTLQGFTTYNLRDSNDAKTAIFIPKGKFFVGWEQSELGSNLRIPIGYDLNSPEGSKFFYFNDGTGWVNVGDTSLIRKGALMIRPIIGDADVVSTSVFEIPPSDFAIFPNPAKVYLNIRYEVAKEEDWIVELLDMSGKKLITSELGAQIPLPRLNPGPYIILITNYPERLRFVDKLHILP